MDKKNVENIFPLTPLQEGMLFQAELAPDSPVYWNHLTFRIEGALDPGVFARAWDWAVAAHGALRTSFARTKTGQAVQIVHRQAKLSYRYVALDEGAHAFEHAARQVRETPPDLRQAPLMAVVVGQTGKDGYAVQWSQHHIILDGWSWPIVLREVFEAYEALLAGAQPARKHRPAFSDYVGWLKAQDQTQAREFWQTYLSTATSAPGLASHEDECRPPDSWSERYRREKVTLSFDESEALRAFCRRQRVTANTLIQCAWGRAAAVQAGAAAAVIGTTQALRPGDLEGVEQMVGMALATVPLVVDLDFDGGAADWLRHQQSQFQNLSVHAHSALTDIADAAGREAARLFDSIVVFENFPFSDSLVGDGTTLKVFDLQGEELTGHPLTLQVIPLEQVELSLTWDTARIDPACAKQLWARFLQNLQWLQDSEGSQLRDVPHLLAEERGELQRALTGPELAEMPATTQRIFEQVLRCPERIAVTCIRRSLSYQTLWAEAGGIADRLEEAGVVPGSRVAVGLTRGSTMVSAILAVWRLGAAYVPVDPSLPRKRLAYVLETAGAQLVITDARAGDAFAGLAARLLYAEDVEPADRNDEWASADALAYVMFTSGSTGKPNGVMVTHANVNNFLESMRVQPGFSTDDTLLAVTTLSFDISVLELFLPLVAGGSVVIADASEAVDGELLQAALRRSAATVMQATPVTWKLLLQSGWQGEKTLKVLCGGEALPQSLAEQLAPAVGALWNLYGPTETTVWSACGQIRLGDRVHVGTPVACTQMMIVNEKGHEVPPGAIGELLIGGEGVSAGYLGNESLTQARFELRSTPNGESVRWFRTGDLASLDEAGRILIHGRRDRQIKLRGFRIETGDIESHLSRAPGVAQCAVALLGDNAESSRLVAFVVMQSDLELSEQALRDHLADQLPMYMIPQAFVSLQALPLTHNLKVDYAKLPALLPARDEAFAGQRFSDVQEQVATIWEDLLGRRPRTPDDDFMRLGGHSLLLAKLANRLRREFECTVSIGALLESASLAAHAELVAGAKGTELPELQAADSRAHFPLSSFQRRLWFLEQLEAARGAHNLSIAFRLPAETNEERILQALRLVAGRHEILRTRFGVAEGVPLQEVLPEPRIDWRVEAVPGAETLGAQLQKLASHAFDLAAAPPWLARVLQLEDGCVLMMVFHHLVMDGESVPLFLEEFSSNYRGAAEAEAIVPAAQYGDFAAWQGRCQDLQTFDQELAYWQQTLDGELPVLRFPSLATRPPEQRFTGDTVSLRVEGELLAGLRAYSRRHAVSMYNVLLTSYVYVLLRYCNQDDVIVGTPLGTVRHALGVHDGLGPYLNTVALRIQAAEGGSFATLLSQVVAKVSEAIEHGNVPFEAVVASLKLPRDLSRTPVFQTLFSYRQSQEDQWQLAELPTVQQPLESGVARTDLTCWVEDRSDSVAIELEYASALFDVEMVKGFAGHLLRLLATVTEHQDSRGRGLLDDAERRRLLEDSGARSVSGLPASVGELIWSVVDQQPDRIAVASGDARLTYRDLKRRCEFLSAALCEQGIGQGTLVALALSRSEQIPVVMLALWELGAAFLPLDLDLPGGRLKHVINDSGVEFVLCEGDLDAGLPDFSGLVLRLDELQAQGSPPTRTPSDSDLAYLIYTSGSTGLPKGVRVGQGAVVNLLTGLRAPLRVRSDDVLAAITTTSFDISILELLLPLTVGGQVYVVNEATSADGRALADELVRSGATMMQGTPASWRLLFGSGWSGDSKLKVLCGGEALPSDLAETLLERCGAVFNLYGPTETTVWSSVAELSLPLERIVIGRPMQNTRIYVVDSNGELVPEGVEGELMIGGAGVALGYHNRGDLTAARFVTDPFDNKGRAYLTGDLGRRLPGGQLEHLGRLDTQLKVRGYRIEAGDVEAHLRQAPGVKDVAVSVGAGSAQDNLLAFVVAEKAGDGIDAMTMRRFLRNRLPRYMIPQQFIAIDSLPLTPNQKVDYGRLPVSAQAALPKGEGTPASTPSELLLAAVWGDLLEVSSICVEDNFFELGGHSLLAVKAAYEIEQASGVHLPAQVFVMATLGTAARHLDEQIGNSDAPAQPKGGLWKPLRKWFGTSRKSAEGS